MKTIIDSKLPCWYELSWQADPVALILRVEESFRQQFTDLSRHSQFDHYFTEFGFRMFSPYLAGSFGFDDALVPSGKPADGFVEFIGKLPSKSEDGSCSVCQGTVRDSWLDQDCFVCQGTKLGESVAWQRIHALTASLQFFFTLAYLPAQRTRCTRPQLLTVMTSLGQGGRGAALGGMYSAALVEWLKNRLSGTVLAEVVNAMEEAYDTMVGLGGYDKSSFRARVADDGWLNLSCPGNACGLDPSDRRILPGSGYEVVSHNVDSSVQQLTLLAGLAALHDQVRRELGE